MSVTPLVTGTDGVVPVYNPNATWQWWGIDDIYTGKAGKNKFVPKVNDYVMDYTSHTTYRVAAVDPTTYIPTLVTSVPSFIPENFTPDDMLFGVGPGTQADTYRMYLNTHVLPYTAAIDARLRIGGSKAAYCKVFLGADTSASGQVISMVYDAGGNFVSQNVPLELVTVDNVTNYSWRSVAVFCASVALNDGELVTAVMYDAQNSILSKRQLLVENQAFVPIANASQKYVSSISLESPFISPTEPNVISFPLNVPITALNLIGKVNYSDGSSLSLPVDGSKFRAIGLDQFISNIPGQRIPLVLSYELSPTEITFNAASGSTKYITAPYTIVTTTTDNSYAVKIYGYPEWKSAAVGYVMKFFITNLDRNIWFEVTDATVFSASTGAFNPLQYGYLQRKSIQIDLSKVSPTFRPYIHTQLMDVTLIGPPSVRQTPWTVSQVSAVDIPAYGTTTYALISSSTNMASIDISCGMSDLDSWLNKVYYTTHPIFDPDIETIAPKPTHLVLMYNGMEMTYDISNWNKPLAITGQFSANNNIYLRFIKRVPNNDMVLSIAAMIIYQVD